MGRHNSLLLEVGRILITSGSICISVLYIIKTAQFNLHPVNTFPAIS